MAETEQGKFVMAGNIQGGIVDNKDEESDNYTRIVPL